MKMKVTQKMVKEIKEARSNGGCKTMSDKELFMTKFNIGRATVCKIIHGDYDYMLEEAEEIPKQEVTKTVTSKPTVTSTSKTNNDADIISKLIKITTTEDKVFKCCLIKNREDHWVPIDDLPGIFNRIIPDRYINDYAEQLVICKNFIINNCSDRHGRIVKNVYCYMTGIQCLLASLIKACLELKVNLTLAHFNPNKKKYQDQVIFDNFGESLNDGKKYESLDHIAIPSNTYLYKYQIDDLNNLDVMYSVVFESSNKKESIICGSIEDSFTIFNFIVKGMLTSSVKSSLCINENEKINGRYEYKRTVFKSSN